MTMNYGDCLSAVCTVLGRGFYMSGDMQSVWDSNPAGIKDQLRVNHNISKGRNIHPLTYKVLSPNSVRNHRNTQLMLVLYSSVMIVFFRNGNFHHELLRFMDCLLQETPCVREILSIQSVLFCTQIMTCIWYWQTLWYTSLHWTFKKSPCSIC